MKLDIESKFIGICGLGSRFVPESPTERTQPSQTLVNDGSQNGIQIGLKCILFRAFVQKISILSPKQNFRLQQILTPVSEVSATSECGEPWLINKSYKVWTLVCNLVLVIRFEYSYWVSLISFDVKCFCSFRWHLSFKIYTEVTFCVLFCRWHTI